MNYILFILLSIYCYVDAYQTGLLINLGAKEINPWLNFLINNFGLYIGIYGFKTLALTFLLMVIIIKDEKWAKIE